MASNPDEPDDLLEGIYQPEVKPVLELRAKKVFPAWLKPRKHYVRIQQWCRHIQKLIKRLKYENGDTLTYLGMPAEDLLDIRALHGTCQQAGVILSYIGFDSTAKNMPDGRQELELSQHEVYELKFIHPSSRVVRDRIERVVEARTMARRTAEKYGPFDVINIDLCDSVAGKPDDGMKLTYFDAILKLCNLQAGRTKPWLLFLTTRAIRDQIQPVAKLKLLRCVLENVAKSAQFGQELKDKLGLTGDAIQAELDGNETFDHSHLVRAFCLGIGKWLLNVMMSAHPKIKVSMLPSYSYTVEGQVPDLVSLGFLFEPVIEPRVDHSGLTKAATSPAPPLPTEAELASLLIPVILALEDVDEILATDDGMRKKTLDQCIDVVSAARYDMDAYWDYLLTPSAWGGRKIQVERPGG